ncbi:MAG TPA: hypothetical protein VHE35_17915 [Kofleriaceae bacterium]|nr:hypothetical protein [Kofleriaceae bacterium]
MPRAARLAAALLVCVTAAGAPACGKSKAKAKPHAAATVPAAVPLAIFVDDQQVASSAELSAEPRPLVEVFPAAPSLDTWLALEAIDASGKAHTTMAPLQTQAGKFPAVAVGADGVELGFRTGGATGPLADPVHEVTRITIKTHGDRGQIAAQVAAEGEHGGGDSAGNREHADEARPAASPDLQIEITGAGGDSVFTGDKLAALPVVHAPSGDTITPGWSLTDLLHAAGVKHPQLVHLTDGEGATLQLAAADFDPAKTVLYLKLNRSGVIRFRVFRKTGETWEVGGELRGITKINIVK